MRWARDVIAPLLVACGAPEHVLCFSGGKQYLSSTASSIRMTWRLQRLAGRKRCGGKSFSSAAEIAAARHRLFCRSCCELQQQQHVNVVHNDDDMPTRYGVTMMMAASSLEGDTAMTATRYTIDVDVHPDVGDVAVKHASQLSRFLDNYPISSHTKDAYAHAMDFVRDFHLSYSSTPAGSADTAVTVQQQCHHEGRDEKGGTGASRVVQQNQPLPVVLDSGCGTGRSSALLARSHPHLPVIGIDRSAVRLSKGGDAAGKGGVGRGRHRGNLREDADVQGGSKEQDADGDADKDGVPSARGKSDRGGGHREGLPRNLLLLRADLVDLWILASRDNAWDVREHFILYPNPYPKRSQLRARWHGHPVFPVLLGLGGNITLRSNWEAYLDEVCRAVLAIHDEAENSSRQGSIALVEYSALNCGRKEEEGVGSGRDDNAGMMDVINATVGSAATLPETENQGISGGTDQKTGVHETGGDARHPAIDIPTIVAAAAASYAYSARVGPSYFVPTVPAATNFEAKYLAVGETVFELRLEQRR